MAAGACEKVMGLGLVMAAGSDEALATDEGPEPAAADGAFRMTP
jgi:hypothetical protein